MLIITARVRQSAATVRRVWERRGFWGWATMPVI